MSEEADGKLRHHLSRLFAFLELLAKGNTHEKGPQHGVDADTLGHRGRQKHQNGCYGDESAGQGRRRRIQ